MKKALFVVGLIPVFASCVNLITESVSCGEMIPSTYHVIDPSDPHSRCSALSGFGDCVYYRKTCTSGKWVAVETGPWYRCECGSKK